MEPEVGPGIWNGNHPRGGARGDLRHASTPVARPRASRSSRRHIPSGVGDTDGHEDGRHAREEKVPRRFAIRDVGVGETWFRRARSARHGQGMVGAKRIRLPRSNKEILYVRLVQPTTLVIPRFLESVVVRARKRARTLREVKGGRSREKWGVAILAGILGSTAIDISIPRRKYKGARFRWRVDRPGFVWCEAEMQLEMQPGLWPGG